MRSVDLEPLLGPFVAAVFALERVPHCLGVVDLRRIGHSQLALCERDGAGGGDAFLHRWAERL